MAIYNDAINLLTSQEKFHIKLGLERVQELLGYFGNPQDKIKCIHVAGTNGKGSVCAMLASVLQVAGYKTGLYTSPHLVEYTERIKINGQDISRNEFAKLIFEVVELSQQTNIPATEFEILTVAAFIYFHEKQVDFAVIETGLGGRLDATNMIKKPEMSIITSIDLDHTSRLGNTIEKIACEKAGIIKQNTPVITLEDNNGIGLIQKKAKECASPLFLAESHDDWQEKNRSLVFKTAELLKIPQEIIDTGIKNTFWPARFQYIEEENLLIDAAHNPAGAKALRYSLDKEFSDKNRLFIYSSLNTKDYKTVINTLFREQDRVILTKSSSSFAVVDPIVIKSFMLECKEVYVSESVEEAIRISSEIRKPDDLLVFTGSIYSIGEFFRFCNKSV